jgi:hypothetical protein
MMTGENPSKVFGVPYDVHTVIPRDWEASLELICIRHNQQVASVRMDMRGGYPIQFDLPHDRTDQPSA